MSEDAAPVIRAPMTGTVVEVLVEPGQELTAATVVAVIESMKMEHEIPAGAGGVVARVEVSPGQTVAAGDTVISLSAGGAPAGPPARDVAAASRPPAPAAPPAAPGDHSGQLERGDLAEVRRRQALTGDAARSDAVARRHRTGLRTARENLEDLCDPGSFVEYGSLAIASQRSRRSLDDLVVSTPADGFIGGLARVNGDLFGPERSRCAVMSYDYTVLAGTQGHQGHRKKDRLFGLCERLRLPVVLFAEGGGGRPGDTDNAGVSGLDCMAFTLFGRLSGLVPLVGVVSGRCFAGNAALLGCCDVIIAASGANIGMAGPAMIEGGGLGRHRPEDIGPLDVQVANGVVDIAVEDDEAAVATARRYLSYFQGRRADWDCADQRRLRSAVPENRSRVYDIRRVVDTVCDTGSVLELRRGWAPGIITALARIEGRPLGVVANNPAHLGGAIDTPAADKAARFIQLCDAHDIPLLFLCDTPGFMVGPEAERTAQVRHFARLFVIGSNLDVPFVTVVLRKGYGLGAQAMAGGSFHAPLLTVSWPTGEFGGMGLEGAVQLGFRKELDAIADHNERNARYQELVAHMYERGKALNTATYFEIDDVIDPAETRDRVTVALSACPPAPPRAGKKRPWVDAW